MLMALAWPSHMHRPPPPSRSLISIMFAGHPLLVAMLILHFDLRWRRLFASPSACHDHPKSHRATRGPPKVSFVSLGCPKALVDSERIITRLRAEGYEVSRHHAGADVVVVNTCGFLNSAQSESLAAIGEALNENGKVIVTGCMGAEPEKITSV